MFFKDAHFDIDNGCPIVKGHLTTSAKTGYDLNRFTFKHFLFRDWSSSFSLVPIHSYSEACHGLYKADESRLYISFRLPNIVKNNTYEHFSAQGNNIISIVDESEEGILNRKTLGFSKATSQKQNLKDGFKITIKAVIDSFTDIDVNPDLELEFFISNEQLGLTGLVGSQTTIPHDKVLDFIESNNNQTLLPLQSCLISQWSQAIVPATITMEPENHNPQLTAINSNFVILCNSFGSFSIQLSRWYRRCQSGFILKASPSEFYIHFNNYKPSLGFILQALKENRPYKTTIQGSKLITLSFETGYKMEPSDPFATLSQFANTVHLSAKNGPEGVLFSLELELDPIDSETLLSHKRERESKIKSWKSITISGVIPWTTLLIKRWGPHGHASAMLKEST